MPSSSTTGTALTLRWDGVSVLVTGAAGFVGRRLCLRLVERGAHVTAVVHRADDVARLPAGVARVEVADVAEGERVRALFGETLPKIVFHLAARLDPNPGLARLAEHVRDTTLSTASVLAAASTFRPDKIIVAGSAEECGPHPPAPTPDDCPPDPRTPYGISKALATRMCLDAWKVEEIPVTVLRLFVAYGPGMSPRFFVRQLVDATVEGRILETTEGRQTRDFTHVEDIIEGMFAACGCPALNGRVVDLCTGRELSLREVCEMWQRISGRDQVARLGARPYRPHEVFRSFGDPATMRDLAGWSARIALEEGLRELWFEAVPPREQERPAR